MKKGINFSDILANIETALIDGCYSQETIDEWNKHYQSAQEESGEKRPDSLPYVSNVFDLASFLVGSLEIYNETDEHIILVATHIALAEANDPTEEEVKEIQEANDGAVLIPVYLYEFRDAVTNELLISHSQPMTQAEADAANAHMTDSEFTGRWVRKGGCRCCGEEYDRKEVERKYGKFFAQGYCTPRCYTKMVTGQ